MNIKNVEFKALVDNLDIYEKLLIQSGAQYIGTDHQIDTYFNTQSGRLKLNIIEQILPMQNFHLSFYISIYLIKH